MMVMMLSSAALRDGELSGSTPAFNRPPSLRLGNTGAITHADCRTRLMAPRLESGSADQSAAVMA